MRYFIAILLFVGAHFGMGALNPASDGHSSWLVPLTDNSSSWLPGLGNPGTLANWLGIAAMTCFGIAILGLFGAAAPRSWVRPAIIVGLITLLAIYSLYFTFWALLPLGLALIALCSVIWYSDPMDSADGPPRPIAR